MAENKSVLDLRRLIKSTLRRGRGGRFALAALFLIALFLVFRFLTPSAESLYWPGWYILRLPKEMDETAAMRDLTAAGIEGALSASTVEVEFMAIPQMESVKLTELDDRLPVGDPRRDVFLTRAGELFRSGQNALVYLPADRGVGTYRRLMRRIGGFENARLMDDRRGRKAGVLLFFIAGALLLALTAPVNRLFRMVSLLPWLLVLWSAGSEALFLVFMVHITSAGLFQSKGRLFSIPAFLVAFTALVFILGNLPLAAAALAASLSILWISPPKKPTPVELSPSAHRRSEHVLFEPIPLTRPTFPLRTGAKRQILILMLTLVAALCFDLFMPWENHDAVPTAGPPLGAFSSPSAYHLLKDSRESESLPNIADLLASTAYQEGFMYGAEYRLPLPGEKLTIRRYHQNAQSILTSEESLVDYDDSWFAAAAENILTQNLGALYATPGGPATVTKAYSPPLTGAANRMRIWHFICAGVSLALVAMAVFVYPRNQMDVLQTGSRMRRKMKIA